MRARAPRVHPQPARATLRLFFDPWELPPADVRRVVTAAVERYRSSFPGRTP